MKRTLHLLSVAVMMLFAASNLLAQTVQDYGIVIEYYDFDNEDWVTVNVTSDNCNNILLPVVNSGSMRFDPVNNIFYMNSVTVNPGTKLYFDASSFNRASVLTIALNGVCDIVNTNSVADNYVNGINAPGYADLVITGSGTLKTSFVEIFSSDGIAHTLFIRNTNVEAIGGLYPITAGGDENLVIENSNVVASAEASHDCAFDEWNNITLQDCHIVYPVGAMFDASIGCIVLNGSEVDSVVIAAEHSGITITKETEFQMAPNPVEDVTTLMLEEFDNDAYLQMVDANGRLVLGVMLPAQQPQYRLDVSSFAAGVYYVTVTSGAHRQTATLIKK
ncbi:MAG: T9SS type A sorting domain-containing protein [Bacteroidales bacterium]|nr:T9SS type A sorting domain-containing protein [Bacteroidales bacterium]